MAATPPPEPELERRARRRLARHGLRLEGEALTRAATGMHLVERWRQAIESLLREVRETRSPRDG